MFIGLGGILGYVWYIVELIPRAVLAPILIFVALDIMVQAFLACPARHAPAVAFCLLPDDRPAARDQVRDVPRRRQRLPSCSSSAGKELPEVLVTVAVGNGFILTAMLWGGFLAELIDRKLKRSALYLGILAVFSFFGVIHSSSPDGNMYLPWTLAAGCSARSRTSSRWGTRARRDAAAALAVEGEQGAPPADLEHPGVEPEPVPETLPVTGAFLSHPRGCSKDR